MNQKIFIKISASLDVKGFFLLQSNDFSARILNDSLSGKKIDSMRNKNLINYVKDEYKNKEITIAVKKIKKKWNDVEDVFFTSVDGLFQHFEFTEKTFTAYPSIWPLYVHNVELNAISFPFDRSTEDAIFVICHELLHSFFYEFVENKYSEDVKKINPTILWDIAEVFNVLVQERSEFFFITKIHPEPYPQHRQLYHEVKDRLEEQKCYSVDCILKALFLITKNSK